MESKRGCDAILLLTTLSLVALGIAMVYSASSMVAQERFGDQYHFLKRQGAFALLGLLFMLLLMRSNYQRLNRLSPPFLVLAFLLLIVVLFPPFQLKVGGISRWLRLGGFTFQPSELAKLALALYLARFFSKREYRADRFITGFLPPLLIGAAMAALVMAEPDFGNAALLGLLALTLLFLSGSRLTHLGFTAMAALPLLLWLAEGTAYRRQRILAFLDPWRDPMGSGFQIIQSYLAFALGGVFGVGLGGGRQKLFYLPEAHTDFIASVIGEELGLIGLLLILIAFGVIVVRGLKISLNSPDPFGYYLGLGLTLIIAIQAAINLGVATGLFPTKGLTLPFLSYGGSSLVINLMAVGLLLSISTRRRLGRGE